MQSTCFVQPETMREWWGDPSITAPTVSRHPETGKEASKHKLICQLQPTTRKRYPVRALKVYKFNKIRFYSWGKRKHLSNVCVRGKRRGAYHKRNEAFKGLCVYCYKPATTSKKRCLIGDTLASGRHELHLPLTLLHSWKQLARVWPYRGAHGRTGTVKYVNPWEEFQVKEFEASFDKWQLRAKYTMAASSLSICILKITASLRNELSAYKCM